MKENEKYQKLDLAAMLEDVQKGHSRLKNAAIRQYANFFEIFTNEYSLDTDDVISISLMLFGVHNSLRIGMVSGMDDEGMKGVILRGIVRQDGEVPVVRVLEDGGGRYLRQAAQRNAGG